MDTHEMAQRTYDAIQKRKKQREMQENRDKASVGWNGYNKYMVSRQRRYYSRKHTLV
jgi:outer membrane receptor for ferrienterochelin and colicin